MPKIIAIILSVAITAGCSCFADYREQVTVMTNVPNAEVFANGDRVGQGTSVQFSAKRNRNVQIMAKAPGYYPAYRSIDTTLSMTGVLDIIGIFFFIIPFIGLLTPGSRTLDENNVALELAPLQQSLQSQ
jgi:hypothetical protein